MKRPILLLAVLSLLGSTTQAQAAFLINDGGFEVNPLLNWRVLDQAGSDGTWFFNDNLSGSPVTGLTVPLPPQGIIAAMTDQGAPGTHVLYQDFVVPMGVNFATLSFQRYIQNTASGFFNGAQGLNYLGANNQQARVDILLASSNPFSVASGDVLLNVFQTKPGDLLESGYSTVNANLTALLASRGGQTLRLRFAEVDNQFQNDPNLPPINFLFGVDDVRLEARLAPTNPVPAPAGLLLVATGVPFLIGMLRRRATSVVAN